MNEGPAHAYLVESIPKGLDDLRGTPGVRYTEEVLVSLVAAARSSIDLTAMYWSLLPDPSGDEQGFTAEQLSAMGADHGRDLLNALASAAGRGVRIRILQGPGYPPQGDAESAQLVTDFPDLVSTSTVVMGDWYGGSGIMHQKLWIFDGSTIYLGSANMDWKSLTQVKELGVVVEDCPTLAEDATRYFEGWLAFSALPPESVWVTDHAAGITRKVPPWSGLVPGKQRQPSPLEEARFHTPYNRDSPLALDLDSVSGEAFLTGCPDEVCAPARTRDQDGLVYTIEDAQRSVCVCVMDFAPISLFPPTPRRVGEVEEPADTPVWWPSLIDAVLSAAVTRKIWVRLLVSKWAHSSLSIEPFLRSLQLAAEAAGADPYLHVWQLEVKLFVVPGWDDTGAAPHRYPGHSRVDHAKYVVTDRRVNIGTSNMTWDYFRATAGTSFNSDHPSLVTALQDVFDRDWASPYASRLD
jgi:phospholipase D3/4